MTSPALVLVQGTAGLYQAGGLRFLLAEPTGAPSLPLDGTWGPPPATVGHYLFVAGTIAAPAAFETALRGWLPPPAASSVAWVAVGADGSPALACRIESAPDGTIAADVVVTVGATQLVLPAGAPLIPWRDANGDLLGFTAAVPPVPGGGAPNGQGTRVAFSGSAGGCLCFTGLFNLFSTPVSATTQVVDVQLDPLRPGDPTRTLITFTDSVISIVPHGSGFKLELDA